MIHLDTNFLIMSLGPGTAQQTLLHQWLATNVGIGMDAIAWSEFHCGPLTPTQQQAAETFITSIEPFFATDSIRAAALFNSSGRRRGTLNDCMIAAICLRTGASLATSNAADFQAFVSAGLQLIVV